MALSLDGRLVRTNPFNQEPRVGKYLLIRLVVRLAIKKQMKIEILNQSRVKSTSGQTRVRFPDQELSFIAAATANRLILCLFIVHTDHKFYYS